MNKISCLLKPFHRFFYIRKFLKLEVSGNLSGISYRFATRSDYQSFVNVLYMSLLRICQCFTNVSQILNSVLFLQSVTSFCENSMKKKQMLLSEPLPLCHCLPKPPHCSFIGQKSASFHQNHSIFDTFNSKTNNGWC